MEKRAAALSAADAIESLMKEVGHPMRLSEVGVPGDAFDIAACHAICDDVTPFNARPVMDPAEVSWLYKQVF
jgi:alcohol dehydrogenase class IV